MPKVPAKKTAAKKVAAKKTAAKKVAAPAAVKPAAPTTQPLKKVAAQKTPAKKTAAKAAKKTTTKTVAPSKLEKTTIIARVDVGFGNSLYLRGEGAELSWDKGIALDNTSPYEWHFSTTKAKGDLSFKFLINDEVWAEGENLEVAKGGTSISSPVFNW